MSNSCHQEDTRKCASHYKMVYVMFNFMCQFEWAKGCPDVWLNSLDMSMKVFQDEINI